MDTRYYIWLIIIGLLYCLHSSSAVKIKRFKVLQNELEVEINTRTLVQCMFLSKKPLKQQEVDLKWGKVDFEGGMYTTVIEMNGKHLEISPEFKEKYNLFTSLAPSGNCTLIFHPTNIKDSGSYEPQLMVKGKVFSPSRKILITVVEKGKKAAESRSWWKKKKVTTMPPTTTPVPTTTPPPAVTKELSFIDKIVDNMIKNRSNGRKMVIATLCITGAFLLCLVILIVVCCKFKQNKKKRKSSDEENPAETMEKKTKSKFILENETSDDEEEKLDDEVTTSDEEEEINEDEEDNI